MGPKFNDLGQEMRTFVVHGTKFEIDKRYTILEPMGQGAYGVVCAARDEESGESFAVKKIENTFEHVTFTKRTVRELRILRLLAHENVMNVVAIYLPHSYKDFEDIYVISELMETDLTSILKSEQPLSDEHSQFFIYQVLRGMKYIHSAGVIHRDLKPRNLLVNSNCDLKICDFGLARVDFQDPAFRLWDMTEYVCTRWYRAPEVLCCWSAYSAEVDIWSCGCIFAEMLSRHCLFKGNSTMDQLRRIRQLLGNPTAEEIAKIPNDKARTYLSAQPPINPPPLNTVFTFESVEPAVAKQQLEMLLCMLQFDPDKRLKCKELLVHPYLAELHEEADEPEAEEVKAEEFEFERRRVGTWELEEEAFREMLEYHSHCREQYLRQSSYDISSYPSLFGPEENAAFYDKDVTQEADDADYEKATKAEEARQRYDPKPLNLQEFNA